METTKISVRIPNTIAYPLKEEADARGTSISAIVIERLMLTGSVDKIPYVPGYRHYYEPHNVPGHNTMLEPELPLPDPEPVYQEAFVLRNDANKNNPSMREIMTAHRRKLRGQAYDKDMERYFYLIKPPNFNSPSRLSNG
jgi:hypothetical protein